MCSRSANRCSMFIFAMLCCWQLSLKPESPVPSTVWVKSVRLSLKFRRNRHSKSIIQITSDQVLQCRLNWISPILAGSFRPTDIISIPVCRKRCFRNSSGYSSWTPMLRHLACFDVLRELYHPDRGNDIPPGAIAYNAGCPRKYSNSHVQGLTLSLQNKKPHEAILNIGWVLYIQFKRLQVRLC